MRANKGTSLRYLWLAPLLVLGLGCCPCVTPPITVQELTPEQKAEVSKAREQLASAETRGGSWSAADDSQFSETIGHLPPDARFQLNKDLFARLNTQKLKPVRVGRPEPSPHVCPTICVDQTPKPPVTQAPPALPAPPTTSVAPAAPATPAVVPARAVGKPAAK
jgi:hypothetical protein